MFDGIPPAAVSAEGRASRPEGAVSVSVPVFAPVAPAPVVAADAFDPATASPQEVFDRVVRHLFAQGRRSMKARRRGGSLSCAYRGQGRTACAAGALIPDRDYSPAMEGHTLHGLLRLGFRGTEALKRHGPLVQRLQVAHDLAESWTSPAALATECRTVARLFDLNDRAIPDPPVFGPAAAPGVGA